MESMFAGIILLITLYLFYVVYFFRKVEIQIIIICLNVQSVIAAPFIGSQPVASLFKRYPTGCLPIYFDVNN